MNNDKIAEYIDGETTYDRWHDHNFEGGVVSIPRNEFIQEVEEIDENMYDAKTIASKYGKSFVAGYEGGEAVSGEIERIVYSFGESCKSEEVEMEESILEHAKAKAAVEILDGLHELYVGKYNFESEEPEPEIDIVVTAIELAIVHYEELESTHYNIINGDYHDYHDSFMDY